MKKWNLHLLKQLATRQAMMLSLCAVSVFTAGCKEEVNSDGGSPSGVIIIQIDGSSTVAPISKAVAEQISQENKKVRVNMGISGTGGGFSKFALGETDISNASRPIKEKEIAKCKENGVEYVQFQVAVDGLSVVVNKKNTWCQCMTTAQLKKLWGPDSKIKKWNELDPSWPDKEIKLYGPDPDSGTYDYFIEEIIGKPKKGEKPCRSDYEQNSIDTALVKGVAANESALGYFGYAYYADNNSQLQAIGIAQKEDKSDCVLPNEGTIMGGKYLPLSRPLFIYVNKASLKKPAVVDFVTYYLSKKGQEHVKAVSYIQITDELQKKNEDDFKKILADLKK